MPGWLLAGVIYLAGGVALWLRVWTGHPTQEMTCACGDPSSFAWFLGWPAYAMTHGHSFFFTTVVHVPSGMNLLDNTSVLALGIVLAPVTWLLGPVASLNVALTAAPALTALSAYGCLRRALGLSWPAAFAGGLAFGFSPFVLRNEAVSHLQVTFLALIPLVFWCCYELAIAQRGKWPRWGAGLAVLMTVQFFVGLEIFTLTVLVMALALLLAVVAAWRRAGTAVLRRKLPCACRGFGLATVLAALLLAYPMWYALAGPGHIRGTDWATVTSNGLLGVLLPVSPSPGIRQTLPMVGYHGPAGLVQGYIGIPALVLLAAAVVMVRRPLPKLCAVITVLAMWLSLGSGALPLSKGGQPAWLWLPWRVLGKLPVLEKVNPANFTAAALWFLVLAAALLIDQLWRGWRAGTVPFHPVLARRATTQAAAAAAAALVLPWLLAWPLPYTVSAVQGSSWVTHEGAHSPPGTVVLFYPFPSSFQDQALIWQVENGMRFKLVGGRGIVAGAGDRADHGLTPGTPEGTMSALTTFYAPHALLRLPPQPTPAVIRSFREALRHWGVTTVVMTSGGRAPAYARRWLATVLGAAPQRGYDAWVWHDVPKLLS